MTLHVLNSGMVGAPALSGTNGTLCAVLDWALNTIAGWQIEYTATNARIYRPQYGNRFRLYVNHDSTISGDARLATIRGCENASAASNAGLIDPFPLASQLADGSSSWLISTTANATARDYRIAIDDGSISGDAWIKIYTNANGTAGTWQRGRWGDYAKRFSADNYFTGAEVRASAAGGSITQYSEFTTNTTGASSGIFIARSIDGTVKSTRAGYARYDSGGIGRWTNAPAYGAGYLSKLDKAQLSLMDTGNSTGTPFTDKGLMCRGWAQNSWDPIVANAISMTALDTIADGSYDPSAMFMVFTATANGGASGVELLEITPTWRHI